MFYKEVCNKRGDAQHWLQMVWVMWFHVSLGILVIKMPGSTTTGSHNKVVNFP